MSISCSIHGIPLHPLELIPDSQGKNLFLPQLCAIHIHFSFSVPDIFKPLCYPQVNIPNRMQEDPQIFK